MSKEDFVRVVAYVIVWESTEHILSFLSMRVYAMCGRLSGPAHYYIVSMAFAERIPVLRVPSIVKCFHKVHVILF